MERVKGVRLVDDLLPVVLDRLAADPRQDLPLEAGKLRVGHQLQDAVARLDRVADDPRGRLVEVVAVLPHEGHQDRIEGATADEPAGVRLVAIERPDEASGVLSVDPEDRREFDMSPLPHRDGLAGPLGKVEQPGEDFGGTAGARGVAAEDGPAECLERAGDPRPRKADIDADFPQPFLRGLDESATVACAAALGHQGDPVDRPARHGGPVDENLTRHHFHVPDDPAAG